MLRLRELGNLVLKSRVLVLFLCELLSSSAERRLEQGDLALQVLDLVHSAELEVLAQLREVLDGLLVFFPLPDQLSLLSLDLLLLHLDPGLLLRVDGLPHRLPVLVILRVGSFQRYLRFVELRGIDEVAFHELLVRDVGLRIGWKSCIFLLANVKRCLVELSHVTG